MSKERDYVHTNTRARLEKGTRGCDHISRPTTIGVIRLTFLSRV